MRRRTPRLLGDALGALLGGLAPASTLGAVQEVWRRAVGELVAANARPVAEHGGVVTVVCTEAVWAQELELLGPELVEAINEALGRPAVQALRCRAT